MLKAGTIIDGKYKILDIIGRGGMSIVYLAINEKANRPWAIKEILKKDFQAEKKEIHMMKRLRHPHLPGIADVIEEGESLLIVMDYIEGRTLEELLKEQGAQPEELVIDWARQICQVLLYLHSRTPAIIYRDMKPANVMLKPDGNVMLIDLGAAREYKPRDLGDTIALGTRGYAAPEQYESGAQSDARTDIYSLGVMMFQLATGKSPHQLQPARNLNPYLSSGLEEIITRCTKIKKEDRYQSCAELLYALNHHWEYDSAYQKGQVRKLMQFLIPAALSVLFGLGAVFGAGMEFRLRRDSYEAYLLAARSASDKTESVVNYRKAIDLNPSMEQAYLELLEECYLEDQVLTVSESEELRTVLIDYGDRAYTNEQALQKNKKGYAEFTYRTGIAYFYKFEEKSNKKYAKKYFKAAAESGYLEKRQEERAKRLYQISDYYSGVGTLDAAGDETVTCRDYWDDLVKLTGGNLVELDNERTALVMYTEFVSQIISRTTAFRDAGVEKQEMLGQLEDVRRHLQTDFSALTAGRQSLLQEELEELMKHMEKAERMIHSAYDAKQTEEYGDGSLSQNRSSVPGRDAGIAGPVGRPVCPSGNTGCAGISDGQPGGAGNSKTGAEDERWT